MMQVKFLRLLQQREYIPVGDTKTVRCDIRVVAATNRNLEVEVDAGRFREDLSFRINVVHVNLLPLRERAGDIERLAMHFLRMVTARNGRSSPTGIDAQAMRALAAYSWPGNIRQLENVIERAALLAPAGLVTLNDLPPRVRDHEPGASTRLPSRPPTETLRIVPPGAPLGALIQSRTPAEALAVDVPTGAPPDALRPPGAARAGRRPRGGDGVLRKQP